jgi:outer membrane protein insertion porin family
VAVPGSDNTFFKVVYDGQIYFPLTPNWTLKLRSEIGYGDGYGNSDQLPFYENFYAGGFGSIRGFQSSTLGPRTTPAVEDSNGNPIPPGFFNPDGEPYGGNLLLEAGLELIFPLPFVEDQRQFRPVIFLDGGNVFQTDCYSFSNYCTDVQADSLRYSVGVGFTWLAPLGPMTFSYAKVFNTSDTDEEEAFQFELGRTF